MKNHTFMNAEPNWANACVGDNGNPNYKEYSKGYSKAANLLLNNVIDNRGDDVDLLIYPICFNMRHSIELRIKGAINEIEKISKIKGYLLPNFDLITSHDIRNIWSYFKENSNSLDSRFGIINEKLNATILDIANIDPTGQTFRYPESNDDQKHLIEQDVINCYILKSRFKYLEDGLIYLVDSLIDEYKLGTFTKNLSRQQIFELTKHLPPYEQWNDNSFKTIKAELRIRYKISSNELTKAITNIKNHYEFGSQIGIKKPLAFLKDEDVLELCEIWLKYFQPNFKDYYKPSSETFDPDEYHHFSWEDYVRDLNLRKQGIDLLKYKLSPKYIADLQALYYFSYDYSENYSNLYNIYCIENKFTDLAESIDDLFKMVFLEKLIKSLLFLNQTDLAEKIVQTYNLDTVFDFMPQARAKQLFKHSELMCY